MITVKLIVVCVCVSCVYCSLILNSEVALYHLGKCALRLQHISIRYSVKQNGLDAQECCIAHTIQKLLMSACLAEKQCQCLVLPITAISVVTLSLGTHVCTYTLCSTHTAYVHMCPFSFIAPCAFVDLRVHTHTLVCIYCRSSFRCKSTFFSLIHLSLHCHRHPLSSPHPSTSLSARNQWALSSAECDVMKIFAVTGPEGEVPVSWAWPIILEIQLHV